ncbi:DUF2357 domain-containing protein [Campylobacter devanensis]|uniref:DUF2357 domain-containing protein n=1 Tax=Campylobacter devanensis TaxID=3161138 RepID=UPI000A33B467|nr:DUF2357 domain-containing protein [Campylobacter sp. P0098]
MKFCDIYKIENREVLLYISWINNNLGFDKSTGHFKQPDLFTFLKNVSKFDYSFSTIYDDVYYILEYTHSSIVHLMDYINQEIQRDYKITKLSEAKELDSKSNMWIAQQNGRTVKEKLAHGKIKALKRRYNVDTYENRIFKKFLKDILVVCKERNDLKDFELLFEKVSRWLKSNVASEIDEHKKIIYNNLLLHHPRYKKIYKSYRWLHSLDDKYTNYLDSKNAFNNKVSMLKFDLLSTLQHRTDEKIFPNLIQFDDIKKSNNMKLPDFWSINQNAIENLMSSMEVKKEDFIFSNLHNIALKIIKKQYNLKPSVIQNENYSNDEIFADIFSFTPLLFNKEYGKFKLPSLIKQKIDSQIIEASGAKILDLKYPIFTLPEIIQTYDIGILKYFVDNLKEYIKDAKLNYLVPDYISIFEFSNIKKILNSYFTRPQPLPESILAAFTYIFKNPDVKAGSTLYYLSFDNEANLYLTPLVIKHDETLKNITNGIFIERHPSKILPVNTRIIEELEKDFGDNAKEIFQKLLVDGINEAVENKIKFYKNGKTIHFGKKINKPNFLFSTIKDKISKLYDGKNIISDKDNIVLNEKIDLQYFSDLVEKERQGYVIWGDSLPNLSIEIIKNGYYHDFILVDKNSRLVNKNIEIKNHFIIPSDETNISFALKYGDERSNYRAVLKSPDLPYSNDVECELLLTYDYEAENPYKLIYKPLDTTLKSIEVQWTKSKNNFLELPTPQYPPRKTWDDLENFKGKKNSGRMNLLKLVAKELREICMEEIQICSGVVTNIYNIKKGFFFCKDANGNDIFCHIKDLLSPEKTYNPSNGDTLYFGIKNNTKGYYATYISPNKKETKNALNTLYYNKINFLQFLIFTIWRDHCLDEEETPISFKSEIKEALENISNFYGRSDLDDTIKNKLTFILSGMHIDIPDIISNIFVKYSNNIDSLKMNMVMSLALSVGNCDAEWQKTIFQNILSKTTSDSKSIYALMLAKIFWRSKKIIEEITKEKILEILKLLLKTICANKEKLETCNSSSKLFELSYEATSEFELLLAMLRLRNKFHILLPSDDITNEFISIVDFFVEQYSLGRYKLKSYLEFEIDKAEGFDDIPDLLYALRVFLVGDTKISKGIKILSASDERNEW